MIIRRIEVEGFRCFRSKIELADLQLGPNVIHAPNETGKSSLVLAIARCLFDRYGTKSEEMLDSRPWGTELSPKILLEVETKGKRYRIEKGFLDAAASRLLEWTGERFEPLAEANAADDRVRGFLSGVTPTRGASDLENWGLARILWMTQQSSRLSPPRVDGSLREKLLEVLGAASLSDKEQRLIEKVEDAFGIFYTPKSEQLKKSGPLADAERELKEAQAQVDQWRSQCEQAAGLTVAAHQAEIRLDEAVSRRKQLEAEIVELDARAKKETETESAVNQKKQELGTIRERWKRWQTALDDMSRIKERIAHHRAEAQRLETSMTSETERLAERRSAFEKAEEEARVSLKRVGELTAFTSTASLQSKARQIDVSLKHLREILEKVESIRKVGEAKAREYASRRQPKDADVVLAKKLLTDVERARMRLEVLGIEVVFEAEDEGRRIRWTTASEINEVSVPPSGKAVFRGIDAGTLTVPGIGKITLKTGAEDAKKMGASLAVGEEALRRHLDGFAVGSVEELLVLRETAARLEQEIALQRTLFSSSLTDKFRKEEDVRRAAEELEQQLGELVRKLEMDVGAVAELPEVDMAALNQELKSARDLADAAEKRLRESEQLFKGAEKLLSEWAGKRELELKSAEALQTEWDAKTESAGTLELLAEKAREEMMQQMFIEAQVKQLESELPPLTARASVRLDQAKQQLLICQGDEREAQARFYTCRAQLEKAAGDGIYSKASEAEERLALAEKVFRSRQLRATASKLLRTLARERHDQLNQSFVDPIQETVGAYFGRIRGATTPFSLGANLEEVRLGTSATADSSLGSHSFGSQEQAMFVVRLALGKLLAERGPEIEPQMIVLDDPLVNTDSSRHERALDLIRQAGNNLQILILTAFPEKYRSLGGKEFDLQAIRHGKTGATQSLSPSVESFASGGCMSKSITFYHNPMSRGRTVHWMLEEIGQPYELKILDFKKGEHKQPAYLAINPMGKIPAIVHGDTVVTETGAICAYLADAFPAAKLAPALDDPARGTYLRWFFFGAGCLDAAIMDKAIGRPKAEQTTALGYGTYRGHHCRRRKSDLSRAVYSRNTILRR